MIPLYLELFNGVGNTLIGVAVLFAVIFLGIGAVIGYQIGKR